MIYFSICNHPIGYVNVTCYVVMGWLRSIIHIHIPIFMVISKCYNLNILSLHLSESIMIYKF